MLLDSVGYSYIEKGGVLYWWCVIQNKTQRCPATVVQHGDDFQHGIHCHVNGVDSRVKLKAKVTTEVQAASKEVPNIFVAAVALVEQAMRQHITASSHQLPKPDTLTRTANRVQQCLHPADPTSLD